MTSAHPYRRHKSNMAGFTLVEVAFSIAIMGLAVITCMALFAAGSKAQARTNLRMIAAITAQYLTDQGLLQSTSLTSTDAAADNPSVGLAQLLVTKNILIPLSTVTAPTLPTGTWAGYANIFLRDWTPGVEMDANSQKANLYVLSQFTAGEPASRLIFRFTTTTAPAAAGSLKVIPANKMQVWAADWRAIPTGAQLRADLIGSYLYFDFKR